jgi:pimeloyl-ACP methyl ester carboxylesterase
VITGEFDEATPAINETVSSAIPGAESVIYPNASHMAHVEDPPGYMRVLNDFLTRVESASRQPARSGEAAAVTETG